MEKIFFEKVQILKEELDSINLNKYNLENNPLRVKNLGVLNQFKKDGYTQYRWVSKQDGKVRDTHRLFNGQIYDINEALKPMSAIPFPGNIRINGKIAPREVFKCRCQIEPLTKKAISDEGEE